VNLKKVDSGVPAAVLRYQANSYQSIVDGDSSSHHYLGLDASLRAFGWRLHHQSSYQAQEGNTHWDSIATWAERSVVNWASTLRLGQGWTDGTFFDSVSFIGGRLATDVRMLPGSRRGFAPSVSGVARTNARVTVTQNGALLYEATVPPGKFTFDDLYPTNAGGDLQVTIHEADGSQETFTVPYAALPGLVRAGAVYYDLSLGYLDEDGIAGRPGFGEATVQYGFNDYVSGYTGANATTDYYSTLVGSAFNTYWGALAVDLSVLRRRAGNAAGRRVSLAGIRIKILRVRYADAGLDEPQQRRQLSFHSRRRPGARPSPQRLAGDDPLQRDVVSAGRQRQPVV
jgi:outer membrane usher protein FimD/PapC